MLYGGLEFSILDLTKIKSSQSWQFAQITLDNWMHLLFLKFEGHLGNYTSTSTNPILAIDDLRIEDGGCPEVKFLVDLYHCTIRIFRFVYICLTNFIVFFFSF